MLQDMKAGQCRSMRAVYTGGEALPVATAQLFKEKCSHSRLYNLYGPTEATVDVTGTDPVRQKVQVPGSCFM